MIVFAKCGLQNRRWLCDYYANDNGHDNTMYGFAFVEKKQKAHSTIALAWCPFCEETKGLHVIPAPAHCFLRTVQPPAVWWWNATAHTFIFIRYHIGEERLTKFGVKNATNNYFLYRQQKRVRILSPRKADRALFYRTVFRASRGILYKKGVQWDTERSPAAHRHSLLPYFFFCFWLRT